MLYTKIKDKVIQKQTCLLKVLVIHIIFRANFWLNLKNSWKESSNIYTTWKVSHTRVLLVLTHHTTWLSHLDGIACFNFSRNLLLSFCLLFLALLVIIKQMYLFAFLFFIFLKSKCPIFHFVYLDGTIFHLIWKSAKKSKIYIHWCFQFSSKNTRTLELLSRGWLKNWLPTCSQEGARLC